MHDSELVGSRLISRTLLDGGEYLSNSRMRGEDQVTVLEWML